MIHDKLSDYQIASCFGDTLSLIYKSKMEELNNDLSPVYAHLDKLDIPQVPAFHRWFARQAVPHWAEERFRAIEHINKIRLMYRKMKKSPELESLDIQKAKTVPVTEIYPFALKRGNMTNCCFHKDDRPSMKINKNNTVKCFSCGFFGDSIKLFQTLNKVGFKEAVEALNKI